MPKKSKKSKTKIETKVKKIEKQKINNARKEILELFDSECITDRIIKKYINVLSREATTLHELILLTFYYANTYKSHIYGDKEHIYPIDEPLKTCNYFIDIEEQIHIYFRLREVMHTIFSKDTLSTHWYIDIIIYDVESGKILLLKDTFIVQDKCNMTISTAGEDGITHRKLIYTGSTNSLITLAGKEKVFRNYLISTLGINVYDINGMWDIVHLSKYMYINRSTIEHMISKHEHLPGFYSQEKTTYYPWLDNGIMVSVKERLEARYINIPQIVENKIHLIDAFKKLGYVRCNVMSLFKFTKCVADCGKFTGVISFPLYIFEFVY